MAMMVVRTLIVIMMLLGSNFDGCDIDADGCGGGSEDGDGDCAKREGGREAVEAEEEDCVDVSPENNNPTLDVGKSWPAICPFASYGRGSEVGRVWPGLYQAGPGYIICTHDHPPLPS